MTKKVMLIYRVIILIPYVNLMSFFVWAIHLTYCLIATPMKKMSDVIIRPALSLLAMVAAWKVVSIIYGAITNGGGWISRGRYFVYLLCRSGGRHRVLHKLGADSKAKRENTV